MGSWASHLPLSDQRGVYPFFSRESVNDLNVAIAFSKSGASPYTMSR